MTYQDILLNNKRIIANRLDKEQFVAPLLHHNIVQHLSSIRRRIRCIENGYFSLLGQPFASVLKRSDGALLPYGHRLLIVGPKELVALVGGRNAAPIFAQIVDPRKDAHPVQVARQFFGNVGFAASRQSNHGDHVRFVHIVDAFACRNKQIELNYDRTTIELQL